MLKLRFSVLALCLAALLGCGPEGTPKQDTAAGAGTKSPQAAEELTIGIYNDAGNVSIWGGGAYSPWVLDSVCEKLAGPNPYGPKPQMILAEYIKPVSEDNRVWEIKLKKGIKWHDGTPLTSEDVKFTIDYNREGPSNNRYSPTPAPCPGSPRRASPSSTN